MSPLAIVFRKQGKEIKKAIKNRRRELQQRLDRRKSTLDDFLQDKQRVRSYMIRSMGYTGGHGSRGYTLYSKDDISSEEYQEIAQLCRRIHEIEQELHRLRLITTHLDDDTIFELSFNDLISYGFEIGTETE